MSDLVMWCLLLMPIKKMKKCAVFQTEFWPVPYRCPCWAKQCAQWETF